MKYEEWEQKVPSAIKDDPLWKMTVYRQALFIGDIGWFDVCKLAQDSRTLKIAGQLYDSLGGISATIAEGYSRGSDKDQARFYEYALGSAREVRDWYFKSRYVLGEAVSLHRMNLTVQIIRQLLTIVPEHRGRKIREEIAHYDVISIDTLLSNVPMSD
ncbi:MAG: four helix bundle protein [Chloroflexota bacterium]